MMGVQTFVSVCSFSTFSEVDTQKRDKVKVEQNVLS